MKSLQTKIEGIKKEINELRANKENKSKLAGKILKLIRLEVKLETKQESKSKLAGKILKEIRSEIENELILETTITEEPITEVTEVTEVTVEEIKEGIKTEIHIYRSETKESDVVDGYTKFIVKDEDLHILEPVIKTCEKILELNNKIRCTVSNREVNRFYEYKEFKRFYAFVNESNGKADLTVPLPDSIHQFSIESHPLIIDILLTELDIKLVKSNAIDSKKKIAKAIPSLKKEAKARISKEAIAARDLVSKIKKESYSAKKSELSSPLVNQVSEWVRIYNHDGYMAIAAVTTFDPKEHDNCVLTVYKTQLEIKGQLELAIPKKLLLDQLFALHNTGVADIMVEQTSISYYSHIEDKTFEEKIPQFSLCYGSGQINLIGKSTDDLILLFHGEHFDGNKSRSAKVVFAN